MYAIVEIAGLQYKVGTDQRIFVNRLEANEGTSVEFDKVLLVEKDGNVTVGSPVVDGARVAAKVLSHMKGDKVIVFKKKRRKGYQKMNGHRQYLTELWITGILGKGEKASDAKKEVDSILKLKAASHQGSIKKRSYQPSNDVVLEENVAAEPETKAEPKKKAAPKKRAAAPAKKAEGTAAKKPAAKKSTKKKED